jgi:hypothetical protein
VVSTIYGAYNSMQFILITFIDFALQVEKLAVVSTLDDHRQAFLCFGRDGLPLCLPHLN